MSAIDHWDVIRYLLGVALVACNVGVWRGVSLEYSDEPWTKETGKRLLIRSLVLEALFAAALFVVDTAGSITQKYALSAQAINIAELNRETAALETRLQARSINEDVFLKSIAGKPKAPVQIMYSKDNDEAFLLALRIKKALLAANWQTSDPVIIPPNDAADLKDKPADVAMGAFLASVTVVVRVPQVGNILSWIDWRLNTPLNALSNAISESLSVKGWSTGTRGKRPDDPTAPPDGWLRVIVGPKL